MATDPSQGGKKAVSTALEKCLYYAVGPKPGHTQSSLNMVQASFQSIGFHWKKVHVSVPLKLEILLMSVLQDDEGRYQRKSTSDLIQKKNN